MANLVQFDPFAEMQALQRQFFGDDWFTSPSVKTRNLPTTDVYTVNDGKELVVEAHLPNFAEKDVDISLDGDMLEISAEHHTEEKDSSKKYIVRESSTSFYRRFHLPVLADKGSIEAHMEEGVLKVKVPMKELPAPKKVAIKSRSTKK